MSQENQSAQEFVPIGAFHAIAQTFIAVVATLSLSDRSAKDTIIRCLKTQEEIAARGGSSEGYQKYLSMLRQAIDSAGVPTQEERK